MTSGAVELGESGLNSLGIDEVEPWICEDTFENRRILRNAKLMWSQVLDEEGLPTGLTRAYSPEALIARRDSTWDSRKPIMVNPSDRYSDFVGADDYPADFPSPWWLKQRIRAWEQQGIEGTPPADRRAFPTRCGTIRTDGTRCWNWAPAPKKSPLCKQHRPWTVEIEAKNAAIARVKLAQAAPAAADGLEELALNATSEPVRLKAITEILDRVGVRGGIEIDQKIEIEISDPAAKIRDRLRMLAERSVVALEESIPDAEVVPDDAS